MDPTLFTSVGVIILTVLGIGLGLFARLLEKLQGPALVLKKAPGKEAKEAPPLPQRA